MPIYEYLCETCKETFSLLLKMSSGSEEIPCPKCGAPARKQISACSIGTTAEGPSCSVGGG